MESLLHWGESGARVQSRRRGSACSPTSAARQWKGTYSFGRRGEEAKPVWPKDCILEYLEIMQLIKVGTGGIPELTN